MQYTCHSGGAIGADTWWELKGNEYGVKTVSYSFNSHAQYGMTRIILNEDQLEEGWNKILETNQILRRNLDRIKPYSKKLLSRNWFQVKNSNSVFAITRLRKGQVLGGTAWAVQMGINEGLPVYVFNQDDSNWFVYSHTQKDFLRLYKLPALTSDFTGIGSRNLELCGKVAIEEIYKHNLGENHEGT